MKFKLFLLVLFFGATVYAQNEVYYFKDVNNEHTIQSIENASFKQVEKRVLDEQSKATYWFKIPAYETTSDYIFRIMNVRVKNPKAFQNGKELAESLNERFTTFKFHRKAPVYIRINCDYTANYPFSLETEQVSNFNEKKNLIINSFYYGFAFLTILYCLLHFYLFKDPIFRDYALLLMSLGLGFLLLDGMGKLFMVDNYIIENIAIFCYVFLAYFSANFTYSFLELEKYYPNLKLFSSVLIVIISILAILFFIFKIFTFYVIVNFLVFSLIIIYWFVGLLIFNKNIYTKIFVSAYAILILLGVDYFLLQKVGLNLFGSNSTTMKYGGLLQMIIVSYALLYREKILRISNHQMKDEIINYANEIKEINNAVNNETKKDSLETLSIREREIFDFIILGQSNKEISNNLNISVNTVKFHIKNIYEKLDIKSRKEAIILEKSMK